MYIAIFVVDNSERDRCNAQEKWKLLGLKHLITCWESGIGSKAIIRETECAQFLDKSFINDSGFFVAGYPFLMSKCPLNELR